MLEIENIIFPSSLDEALATLREVSGSVVLGGCGYLRLGSRKIGTAIDLSKLGLDEITQTENGIEIGAMVSLRELEINPLITGYGRGLLARSVENIVGIQLRKCVTLGGSVAGRYPFSDPITALLALDAQLLFHGQGMVFLKDYLEAKGVRDILTKIILPKNSVLAAFTSVRKSATDYAVLNCAVAKDEEGYRIVVGSRPSRAVRVDSAEHYLAENGITTESAKEAGKIAVETIQFGDNPRGSAEYRKKICPVLIERALLEVADAA
ncbi:FAD binding domain-containing protein [Desulforhopalus sp. 52FAK]